MENISVAVLKNSRHETYLPVCQQKAAPRTFLMVIESHLWCDVQRRESSRREASLSDQGARGAVLLEVYLWQ